MNQRLEIASCIVAERYALLPDDKVRRDEALCRILDTTDRLIALEAATAKGFFERVPAPAKMGAK